ncbi:MAG: SpoIIE family protein phosphatase [Bacteroidia bacterium]|nr:SpoIIE family protein phosphatase [Bacteroidia bacterium]
MKKFLTVLIFLFTCHTISAQKSPYYIRNFKSSEYHGFNQTWQCVQDSSGLIYIASTSAIYIYDGIRWYNVPVKRGAATRQLQLDANTGVIYVGSVADFGCIERDAQGMFVYRSFVDQLSEEQKVFTDVWESYQIGSKIYFESSERIFIIENKKVIGTIEPDKDHSFALMFGVGNRLFVKERKVGLMEIVNDKLQLVPNSEFIGEERLLGILQFTSDTLLLLTGDNGLFKMGGAETSNPTFRQYHVPGDTILNSGTVLGCEWINEDEFGVYSRIGFAIYDRSFRLKAFFNRKTGLSNETITEMFVDREKNIWLAHNDGCSMICYDVPAVTYSGETGLTGTLEVAVFSNDTMYVGTSEGLYMKIGKSIPGAPITFRKLNIPQNEVWDIKPYGSHLLISSSMGLFDYNIKTNLSTPITSWYTNETQWIDTGKICITAEKGGISVLKNENNTWHSVFTYELPGIELLRMSTVIKSANGIVTLSAFTRFKTILQINLGINDSVFSYREYDADNGLATDDYFPVAVGDSVYYVSYFDTYRYIPALDVSDSSDCFRIAPDIHRKIKTGQLKISTNGFNFRMFTEEEGNKHTVFFGWNRDFVYPIPVLLGELFAGENIQFAIGTPDSILWIMNQQDLVQYDLRNKIDTAVRFNSIITGVKFSGDTIQRYFPSSGLTVPYENNSVKFNFAAPYFTYNTPVQFQYMLEGFDTSWSEPSGVAWKEYTNLHEGTYTFVVRGFNSFGMKSTESRYSFTILAPWYRTGWAYTGYGIGFILTLMMTVRLSAKRLRKQKEKLEEVVQIRTKEVVDQKQQIEKQKADLEEAYTGIQDSIQYAKRIQNAILPEESYIRSVLTEYFILFEPRDIVSGDFYWITEKQGLKFVACVDCTGHGVPGALMSMIGNTLLNQILIEKNITDPGQILNHLHEGVRQALKQDVGGDTRDGMDISLVVIDPENNSLTYAGANRNLWIIRNKELIETKADKFAIAGSQQEERRQFTSHRIPLLKGDMIYMTTDGYADQFGGPKGKKFMVRKLQELLLVHSDSPVIVQREKLFEAFRDWKGSLEQVDDVLVIGIKF